ncbi:MAG: HAD family hydrolase [Nocardioides sp.]
MTTSPPGRGAPSPLDWGNYDAVLFDLDGVITPTAEIHRHAWAELFTAYLAERAERTGDVEPYSSADYFTHIDGKPRYDGVRDLLASRDIELTEGAPDDDPSAETVGGLGNRKNRLFNEIIERDGVRAYAGSIELLDHLAGLGIPLAVVSSSKNAPAVLRAAGLADRFRTVVDGAVAAAHGIAGKPAPDMFEYAAAQLGVADKGAVVVEDAVSGVQAGAAGDFALVIGVDRGAGAAVLVEAGADVVVDDLAELVP